MAGKCCKSEQPGFRRAVRQSTLIRSLSDHSYPSLYTQYKTKQPTGLVPCWLFCSRYSLDTFDVKTSVFRTPIERPTLLARRSEPAEDLLFVTNGGVEVDFNIAHPILKDWTGTHDPYLPNFHADHQAELFIGPEAIHRFGAVVYQGRMRSRRAKTSCLCNYSLFGFLRSSIDDCIDTVRRQHWKSLFAQVETAFELDLGHSFMVSIRLGLLAGNLPQLL